MTRRRVRKLGEYFLFFCASFSFGHTWPNLDQRFKFHHFIPMTYTRLLNDYFLLSHTSVFWQTTLLKNRVTCISEVFVSVLMASFWPLERKISRILADQSTFLLSSFWLEFGSGIAHWHDLFFSLNLINQKKTTKLTI
jgi:hypothetical protein